MLRKLNSIVTVAISSSRTLPFLTKQYLNCSSTPTPIPPVFLMEPAAAIVQEPIWTEESHVIAQLLGAYHVYGEEQGQQDQSYEVPSLSWCSSAHAADSNHCFPQSDCYSTSSFLCPTPSHFGDESCGDHLLNYFMVTLNPTEKSSDDWVDSIINNVAGLTAPDHEVLLIKRKPHTSEDKAGNEISNKKRRDSSNVMKSTKKAQFERRQKNGGDEEENNGQTCSSYSSEADTDAFRDLNGGSNNTSSISKTSNPSRKTRANRSPATDPQSLYARKRRERINARLRILQNLVPNGTKVDISTMLEEAVHYVKFLQLQIKFLSSDELWMYAPIAYSGVNIGAELMVSSPQQL